MHLDIASSPIKSTRSRCPACGDAVDAVVLEREGGIVMRKACPRHGLFETLLARDARFWWESHGATDPSAGCCGSACGCGPADSGSGADPGRDPDGGADATDQTDPFETLSTCIALIEIVDSCNLSCPTCYAASPFGVDEHVDCTPYDEIVARIEAVVARKGFIDILQLSGGEPTIHPRFLDVLDFAIAHDSIGYVLVNTNAVRVARDAVFRAALAERRAKKRSFELYVQFDGPQEAGQRTLRGADLRALRERAIDEAGALGVPSTLAMTVIEQNLAHLGETLRFAMERPHVRGITFQPCFTSGRVAPEHATPDDLHVAEPITAGDVILRVVEQSDGVLTLDDFTPLPCGDPNCHQIGYVLRLPGGPVGLGRLVDLSTMQSFLSDRVDYALEDLARCGCESEPLGALLESIERGDADGAPIDPAAIPLRLFVKPFMDAWTFDQDRIDRCCTHVIRPDGRLDSFCRYYLAGGREAIAGKVALTTGKSDGDADR